MAAARPNGPPMTNTASTIESGPRWYALHVRSRYEKAVSSVLQYKGFAEFLPLYRSRRQWAQRITEIELPLFPGYVFCSFNPILFLKINNFYSPFNFFYVHTS